MLKEQAMEIPYDVHCAIENKAMGENEVSGAQIIEEYTTYRAETSVQKENELKEKNIINKWSDILKLQKKNLEKSKGTLWYRYFTVGEDGTDRWHSGSHCNFALFDTLFHSAY